MKIYSKPGNTKYRKEYERIFGKHNNDIEESKTQNRDFTGWTAYTKIENGKPKVTECINTLLRSKENESECI